MKEVNLKEDIYRMAQALSDALADVEHYKDIDEITNEAVQIFVMAYVDILENSSCQFCKKTPKADDDFIFELKAVDIVCGSCKGN